MTINMGNIDRGLRAIVGLVLLYLAYAGMFSTWAWAGYAVGAVMLVTAAIGMCPLYTLFGWNTCATKDKSLR